MPRKNKMEGAIPGAGRPKKEYVRKSMNISPEAADILDALESGKGYFVSQAIIEKSKGMKAIELRINDKRTCVVKLIHTPTGITGVFIKEYKPTGKPYTTQIMTDKGIYFAPSYEFRLIN